MPRDLDASLENIKRDAKRTQCKNGAVVQKRFNRSTGKVKLNPASIGK